MRCAKPTAAPLGAEYMYITDQNQKRWWQQKLESIRSKPHFNADKKKHILDRLTAAEGLERFLHTKYVGQKRFSLEGGESFIAAMDELIQQAGAKGVQEIVIGMAHRGRLNVLVNSLGKMPADLFAEFDHTAKEDLPAGDVKYHQGFSSDVTTPGGPVHLSLAFNPSHLEIVNPVVEGSVRARMDRRGDPKGLQVLPVLVHGDAAIAGQGVVWKRWRWPKRVATPPAARCTSSSTTRSASPPATRATRARRCIAPTLSR
jgi:2-oxoglutarate dehydrogenase E1 component